MRNLFLGLVCAAVSACGGKVADSEPTNSVRPAIAPQQFALVPCQPVQGETLPPCQLLAAGGKYYLMGAPEGALLSLRDEEIRLLDGVLLFTLLPDHIDGLDTVRNTTWMKGRAEPLLVAGPEDTETLTNALDLAFEVSDAEAFAIQAPPGGFDASLLRPVEVVFGVASGSVVVNTGDLVIRGFYAPSDRVVYRAEYSGQIAAIGMCGGDEDAAFLQEIAGDGAVSPCNDSGEIEYIVK